MLKHLNLDTAAGADVFVSPLALLQYTHGSFQSLAGEVLVTLLGRNFSEVEEHPAIGWLLG